MGWIWIMGLGANKQMHNNTLTLPGLGAGLSEKHIIRWAFYLLADLGEAKGCSTNTFVIHSLIHWLIL